MLKLLLVCALLLGLHQVGVAYWPDPDLDKCREKYQKTTCTIEQRSFKTGRVLPCEGGSPADKECHEEKHQLVIYPSGHNDEHKEFIFSEKPGGWGRQVTCYWDGENEPRLHIPCNHFLVIWLLWLFVAIVVVVFVGILVVDM